MRKSWLPRTVEWVDLSTVYAIELSADCKGVIKFIVEGHAKPNDTLEAEAMLAAWGSQLDAALWKATNLHQRRLASIGQESTITIQCIGIFRLENSRVCLLVGGSPEHTPDIWMPAKVTSRAQELWREHLTELENWKSREDQRRRQLEERLKPLGDPYRNVADYYQTYSNNTDVRPEEPSMRPLLTASSPAIWLPEPPRTNRARERRLWGAVAESKFLPSRDGTYQAIVCEDLDGKDGVLVTWVPRGILPTYLEVRTAASKTVPRGFTRPCRVDVAPPTFDLGEGEQGLTPLEAAALDAEQAPEDAHRLRDVQVDERDAEEGAKQVRSAVGRNGFEAIGWYQGHHSWCEDRWGVYLHAKKLDDLADAFRQDLMRSGNRSPALSALLSCGLVYRHELFHARVEACTTLLEVSSRRARHLRYKKQVYDALKMTDGWLEEALANWMARAWVEGQLPLWEKRGIVHNPSGVLKTVEEWLDFAPAGYRQWRCGNGLETWRTFASQLATGRPAGRPSISEVPLEGLFKVDLPFEFGVADVPAYFVGRGAIADAFFSAPSRREAVKLLRHFQHVHLPERGKGSHEIWRGPRNRVFSLPARDPLSVGVFKSLLGHLELTKEAYLRDVRPML